MKVEEFRRMHTRAGKGSIFNKIKRHGKNQQVPIIRGVHKERDSDKEGDKEHPGRKAASCNDPRCVDF